MPTRNVVLTERHEAFIKRVVAEGRYQNASEVLREGLRLIEARDAVYERKLEALNQAIRVGVDDIEAGRYVELPPWRALDAYLENISTEAIASCRDNAAD